MILGGSLRVQQARETVGRADRGMQQLSVSSQAALSDLSYPLPLLLPLPLLSLLYPVSLLYPLYLLSLL